MLSITKLASSPCTIASYVESRRAVGRAGPEDYYSESQAVAGLWLGSAAERLGLAGADYRRTDFEAILGGASPAGDPLTGQLPPGPDGEPRAHRPGWDLTFSAPKPVSAAWALADEVHQKEIEAAQAGAVQAAMQYIEAQLEVARRGKAGAEHVHADLVGCAFLHGSNRNGDPDLHSHLILANAGWRDGGGWGSLEPWQIYQYKLALGAIYRAELAAQMQQLGYAVEAEGDSFTLAQIPEALCKTWSSRRAEIEQEMEARGTSGGKAAEVAALSTRAGKQHELGAAVRQRWAAEAKAHGFGPEQLLAARANTAEKPRELDIAGLLARLTVRNSTFERRDLVRAAAIELQVAGGGAGRIEQEVEQLLQSSEIVRLSRATLSNQGEIRREATQKWTTQEMRALERAMVASAEGRTGEGRHQLSAAAVDAALAEFAQRRGFRLSEEQEWAVRYLCEHSGGVRLVQGGAGTGKSTMMEAARLGWEAAGYKVLGAALAGKAARGLQEGSGIQAQTLHSLLQQMAAGEPVLDKRTVLVVDEAGMIGSRQMARVLMAAEQAGAKVVLIGDSRQLQAIDAGGAFRALQDSLGCVRLDEIRRQRDAGHQSMVYALVGGQAAAAIAHLKAQGGLHVDSTPAEALVERWYQGRDHARPGESLMLAGTRAEVRRLNALAREKMAADARLYGPELAGFCAGDRVLFLRNCRQLDVQNGLLGTVVKIRFTEEKTYLDILTDAGQKVSVDPAEYQHLSYGYAVSVHKAQGATVDKSYVLLSESMADKEWVYVAASRHRESVHVYLDQDMNDDLEKAISRSRQKDTTLDYVAENRRQAQESEYEQEEGLEL